ncbi:hypothetical protein IWX90DRAFT_423892 [Phyllosticta citrichinensis]|uniref:Secreted protein n=1 Tax=Phyllosticta citrichinensis TaxID=1130410 RepID=A0ABR1Y2D2_9PEZI
MAASQMYMCVSTFFFFFFLYVFPTPFFSRGKATELDRPFQPVSQPASQPASTHRRRRHGTERSGAERGASEAR